MKSGVEHFKGWLERMRFNQRQAAAYFGWDETFISHILSGKRTPGLANAVKIEELTGIPARTWVSSELDESESAALTASRRRAK